ncbi:MAG: Omp28-related outer membrane protein [Bacteroidales bacterium]|nr:Omp28-related outer membrane protein [Bacteroidales bacterium]
MKKFFLSALLAFGCIAASAQLADNQRPVGTYYTDALPAAGVGNPSEPGHFTVYTAVPMSQFKKIGDAKIVGVRFGLDNPIGETVVHIRPVVYKEETADIYDDFLTIPVETTKRGWNYVSLPTPLVASGFDDASALLLGFEYDQTKDENTAYPLMVNNTETDFGLLFEGSLDGKEGIYDFSPTGSLCMQFVCEGDIPEYDVVADDIILDKHAMDIDAKSAIMVNLYNYGTKEVRGLNLDVMIDGEKVQTLTQKSAIGTLIPKNYLYNVLVPENVTPGVHKLTVKAVSVGNDPLVANLDDDAISINFTAISDGELVERDRHLVEHFTSVDCVWCPRGSQFLQALCAADPKVTIVSIHGNMGKQDPYCTEESVEVIRKLGINSFPGAAVNRIAFDDGSYSFNLSYEPEEFDTYVSKFRQYIKDYSEVCIAPVVANAMLSEKGDYISIDVKGEGSTYLRNVLSDCVLNVYVIENELINRQIDNHGNYDTKYVHNNVMRKRVTRVDGTKLEFLSSSSYKNHFAVPLNIAWRPKNLEVVAFITRVTDNPWGRGVINATRVPVQNYVEGIVAVETDTEDTPVFDLSGRVAQPAAHGVFIQNGKKIIR